MEITVTPDAGSAARTGALWIARRVRSAVRLRGTCRLALSGGSTPALMFDDLATLDLPWRQVHIFQVDERVAPDGDADRNAEQLRVHLLECTDIKPANVHLMPVTAAALPAAARRYGRLLAGEALDIVHLGIGDDGHTASWPPDDPVIDVTEPVGITAPFNGRVRMTMTPPVVNAARARMVLASGAAKADPIAGWLLHREALPIARLRRTNTVLIADEAAAAGLTPLHHLAR